MASVQDKIRLLAQQHANQLKARMDKRVSEMANGDRSHSLIYEALGVTQAEGELIDVYQNKGRFLYRYAGTFLEEATKLCFLEAFPESGSIRIPNTMTARPKTFEIDCLEGKNAIEIKWRDATTDGDHVVKERSRIKAVSDAGYTPIRVMFYYPNRSQAMRIQLSVESLYRSLGGEYHFGDGAWDYVLHRTGIDLKAEITAIATENARSRR